MSIVCGTAHFVSKFDAYNYYSGQGYCIADVNENAQLRRRRRLLADVNEKLAEGAIFIGKPTLKAGETLIVIQGEGRYAISEG